MHRRRSLDPLALLPLLGVLCGHQLGGSLPRSAESRGLWIHSEILEGWAAVIELGARELAPLGVLFLELPPGPSHMAQIIVH